MKLSILLERAKEIAPLLRRSFINTLFDATFTQLGVIIGSAFAENPDLQMIIGTLVASSVALGISTGVSVYESETLERERKLIELERALFRELDGTMITKNYRSCARVLALVNFLTPFLCCGIILIPMLFVQFHLIGVKLGAWISVVLALSIIFVAGTYLGRLGKKNPLLKGIRMVIFGVAAFIIGFVIQNII
ncbi:MAG: hypothetical protein ACOC6G_03390 [Thermoproteota archaeon]